MRYLRRTISKTIAKALKTFPSVVLTGPRQSGKTTLLKTEFGRRFGYVTLENPDVRRRAREDPIGFLDGYRTPVVIDEIQHVPELLSYVKTRIDENRRAGQYVLTGSQNFALMQNISQSLAGRAAVLTLAPFSYAERTGKGERSVGTGDLLGKLCRPLRSGACGAARRRLDVAEALLRGQYPEIAANRGVDRQLWCASYISTYVERDVRKLAHAGDIGQFENFVRLIAVRTGQILNVSDVAREIGVAVPTARRWLSVLEAGYQIFLLRPYYRNIGKRLVKSPKVYFNDTALASFLLGLHDAQTLLSSPYFPHLFETYVVADFLKRFLNFGELPSLYYLRTRDGLEIDIVIEAGQKLHLFEVKSTSTIAPGHAASLARARNDLKASIGCAGVISRAGGSFSLGRGIMNFCWHDVLSL